MSNALLPQNWIHCKNELTATRRRLPTLMSLRNLLFVDTFGNVAVNDKCWDIIQMGQLGNFKNGLNYSKGEIGKPLKIIGVGDFQNIKCLSSFDNISYINIEDISQEYLLHNEDIVFVRSNGNKNLVGRCLEVFPNSHRSNIQWVLYSI